MQIPHCPCRCHKAFLATFCVGSGDVWPASLSLPSGSLLGLAGGKAQQETGGEVPPVRVLVPCWLHPGWFPVAGHSPARQHLLGSSLTPLGQGSCCPLHYPQTLAVTCSSLTLCVSTQTVYVISPPRITLMDCAIRFLSGPWSPMEMVNQSRGEDSELAWVAELRH